MCPSGPISTPAVDPHVLPSCSGPHSVITVGLGLGRLLLAGSTTSVWEYALPPDSAIAMIPTICVSIKRPDTDMIALPVKRPAPKLISAEMVKSMKPGSVIVDLAVETGGNCELAEAGKVVAKHGVKIVGHLNVPGRLATDASMLYANNVFNFVSLLYDQESQALAIDWDDEIVAGTLVTRDGAIVHPALAPQPAPTSEPEAEAAPETEATGPEEAGSDD